MKVSAFVCGLFFLTVLVLFSAPGGEKAAHDELKILIRSTDGENPPELAAFLQEEQDIPLFTVGEKGVRVIGAWGVRLKTPRGRVETGPLLIFLWRDPALTGAIRSEEGFSPRDAGLRAAGRLGGGTGTLMLSSRDGIRTLELDSFRIESYRPPDSPGWFQFGAFPW